MTDKVLYNNPLHTRTRLNKETLFDPSFTYLFSMFESSGASTRVNPCANRSHLLDSKSSTSTASVEAVKSGPPSTKRFVDNFLHQRTSTSCCSQTHRRIFLKIGAELPQHPNYRLQSRKRLRIHGNIEPPSNCRQLHHFLQTLEGSAYYSATASTTRPRRPPRVQQTSVYLQQSPPRFRHDSSVR